MSGGEGSRKKIAAATLKPQHKHHAHRPTRLFFHDRLGSSRGRRQSSAAEDPRARRMSMTQTEECGNKKTSFRYSNQGWRSEEPASPKEDGDADTPREKTRCIHQCPPIDEKVDAIDHAHEIRENGYRGAHRGDGSEAGAGWMSA